MQPRLSVALSMPLTGYLTSTVIIMVTQEKDNTGKVHPINSDDGRRDDCWEVKPMLKSVPKNLWGVYDPSAAPALKGNALGSLLNGPKAKGSVDLVSGFTICPLPYRSRTKCRSSISSRTCAWASRSSGIPSSVSKKRPGSSDVSRLQSRPIGGRKWEMSGVCKLSRIARRTWCGGGLGG